MNCSQVRELSGAYVLGAVPRHERQRVDQHLHRCPRCRRYVGELSEAVAAMGALVAGTGEPPPPSVKQRLLERVALERRGPWARRAGPGRRLAAWWARWHPKSRPAVRAAALALAGVVLLACGWVLAQLRLPEPLVSPRRLQRELAQARLERELWQSLAPAGAVVVSLRRDPRLAQDALAVASAMGDQGGCRLRVLAAYLPRRLGPLEAWVSRKDGRLVQVGTLRPAGDDRWELQVRLPWPPEQLHALQLRTGTGEKVMWATLWDGWEDSAGPPTR